MTKRIYSHDRFKHVSTGPPAGLLTDGNGGYFAIHPDLSFRGWFRFDRSDWDMQKILDSITPLDEGECIAARHMFYGLKREFSSGARDAFHLYGRSLLYECFDFNGRVKLSLDHRKAYEGSRFGRQYDIDVDGSTVRITFSQHSEDGSVEYESHLIIRGVRDAEVLGQWRKQEYAVDRDRGARSEYWVYDALTFIPSRHVIFSSASTDYEARTVVDVAYHHSEEIISTLHTKALQRLPDVSSFGDRKTQAALLCASDSLLSLTQNILDGPHDVEKGIFAGLPWFFQIWSRDELISLGGLIALASVNNDDTLWSDCISIVDRHMNSLLDDGLLPNRHPESELPSVDAIGWLAHRTNVLIDNLRKHKKLFEFCSVDTLVSWHSTLSRAISLIKEHHGGTGQFSRSRSGSHACLFSNGAGQTWMDTIVEGDDGRPGFRIEIQALMLSLYDAVLSLSRLLSFEDVSGLSDERKLFVSLVRSHFVKKGYCCHVIDGLSFDGVPDDRLRPNVFIAYYLAPSLFSKQVWKKALTSYAQRLFLKWGGISTLSSDHPLYCSEYSGIDDRSYHRGDSWYFINNLVAIAMHRLARRSFSFEVLRIMSATSADILETGFAGHASEISSAKELQGRGSLAQAWSAGTFIELVTEYFSKN